VADDLTGLPSARAFTVALGHQAALARRYDRPGAVIVLAARRADDPGCRAAARALRGRLRDTDLVARMTGAEFAVLLPDARAADARELAGELVRLVAQAVGAPAAAGIACFPDGLDRPAGELLADADTALAVAGKATPPVALFDARVFSSGRAAGSRADRLRRALAGDALVLDERPVIDLATGAVDHHVLTARLRGVGEAEGLLEAAERFGLGRAVDRFVVERAVAAGDEGAALVVPIAPGAATDRGFADWLVDAIRGRGPADRLIVAVSEVAAVADLAAVRSLAARIGEFGARLALDEFGRLGAFSLLKALPVHQVRLDSALVRGLPGSDRDRAVVMALVHAAEALGALSVATGVDGAAELTAVRGFGISLGQGDAAGGVRA
jgi:EAL domain-containing protein (putative c-di-GMP-specific phosphodiesterase class I)/GGDEF domain-containing protein